MKTLVLTCAVGLGLGTLAACTSTIESVIKDAKYQPIVPPTQLVLPGTIVNIVQDNPLVLERVCSQKAALGENVPLDNKASTATSINQKIEKVSTIDVGYEKAIKAKLEAKGMSKVSLKLSNVSIQELDIATVVERQDKQSAGCTKAIQRLLAEPKSRLTVVMSILQADAVYQLDWNAAVNVDVGLEKELVAGLGLSAGSVNKTDKSITVTGTGLFWGMRPISSAAAVGLKPPSPKGDGTPLVPIKDMNIKDLTVPVSTVEVKDAPDFADN